MQVKTTMRYHFLPTSMVIIITITVTTISTGKEMGKLESLNTTGRNVKCVVPVKKFGRSSESQSYHMTQQFHSYVYTQKN